MTISHCSNIETSVGYHKECLNIGEERSQTSSITEPQNIPPLIKCSCDLCQLFGNGHCNNFDFCHLNQILPNYTRVSYEIVNAESLNEVRKTIVEVDPKCQICGDTVSGKGILNASDSRIRELMLSEDKVSIYQKKQTCVACYLEDCSSVMAAYNSTKDKPDIFVCQICNGKFECDKEFQRHIGTHERILFPTCPFCGLIIEKSDNILPHIHSHSGARRVKELSDLTQAAKHTYSQIQHRDLNDEDECMSEYSLSDEDGFESCSSDEETQSEFEERAFRRCTTIGNSDAKERSTMVANSERPTMEADSERCTIEADTDRSTIEADTDRSTTEANKDCSTTEANRHCRTLADTERPSLETDSEDVTRRYQTETGTAKKDFSTNGKKSTSVRNTGNHNVTTNIAPTVMTKDKNNNETNPSLDASIGAIQNQGHTSKQDKFINKCKHDSHSHNSSTRTRKQSDDVRSNSTVNNDDFNQIESERSSPEKQHGRQIVANSSPEIQRNLNSTEKHTSCSMSNKQSTNKANKLKPNEEAIHSIWKKIDRSKRLVIKEKLTFSKAVLLKAEFENREKQIKDDCELKFKTKKSPLEDGDLSSKKNVSLKSKFRKNAMMNNNDVGKVDYLSREGKRHQAPIVETRVRDTNSTLLNPKSIDIEKINVNANVSQHTPEPNINDGEKLKRSQNSKKYLQLKRELNTSFHDKRTPCRTKGNSPASNTQIKKWQCRYCEKAFKNKNAREIHEKIHTKEGLLYCDICNQRCTSKGDMVKHMRVHSGTRPYVCDICDKAFSQKNNLKRHYLIHTGEASAARSFKCDQCEKSYTQKAHLQRHQMLHTGERPVKCSRCDEAFVTRRDLKRHERRHELNRIYTCEVCQKKFHGSIKHAKHMRTHEGFKNFGRFECEICEKKFIFKTSLKEHNIALHMNKKPFSCSVCDKSFMKKGEIVSHMMVHEKKHKCQGCKTIFRNRRGLQKHECRITVNHG